ncbi:tyrosine-type recombinase/integrase [Streptomyces sp. NPDC060006]|uniref:tyrosine-type recombinase/integrase n=1 Tax=unclassified Streptomyces TaxID=2593676 RepID=UPI0036D018DB
MLNTIYAYGTRRTESSLVDLVDLRRHRKISRFEQFGSMAVRYGKSSKGAPPKRRTVLLVPEMDWAIDVLGEWVHEIRPRLAPGRHPALWVTERARRMSPRSINEAFTTARDAAGLDGALDLHCLHHSYITHLTEFGYPARFVQVLLSPLWCVHDVQHEPGVSGDLCGGGGYLPPSITQFPGRSDAGAEGVDARLVA